MLVIFYLFLLILGCIFGSFVNVLIDRIPKGESIVKVRSHCDHCKRKLPWYDLIPVFSYILVNGKCRYCKKNISLYYPFVELTTGLLFVIVTFFIIGTNYTSIIYLPELLAVLYYFYIFVTLEFIFFVDLKYGIIPFISVAWGVCITMLWYLIILYLPYLPGSVQIVSNPFLINYLLSGLSLFLIFLMIFLLTKGRGIGFGDVIFVFFIGVLVGFPKIILSIYMAFISGAVISLFLVFTGIKKLKGGVIPFGPFLVFGTVTAIFWGDYIINTVIRYLIGG